MSYPKNLSYKKLDLSSLNEMQRQAVLQTEGSVLILAGAGCGKTQTLTQRMAHLVISGSCKGENLLAITFTNKAAREMQVRLKSWLSPEQMRGAKIGTFHSFAANILRKYAALINLPPQFAIASENDSFQTVAKILTGLPLKLVSKDPKNYLTWISQQKNKGLSPSDIRKITIDAQERMNLLVYRQYQNTLAAARMVDFEDLILKAIQIFVQHPNLLARFQQRFKYVSVDEFQDTNPVQMQFIQLLCPVEQSNLCVVGDDDQAIYGFRGSNVQFILNFPNTYPSCKIIKLTQNYRSFQTILKTANQVIAFNQNRYQKILWSEKEMGPLLKLSWFKQADHEALAVARYLRWRMEADTDTANPTPTSFGILTRTNEQADKIATALKSLNIPFNEKKQNDESVQQPEIQLMIDLLKLIHNSEDYLALQKCLCLPFGQLPEALLQQLVPTLLPNSELTRLEYLEKVSGNRSINSRFRKQIDFFCQNFKEVYHHRHYRSLSQLYEQLYQQFKIESFWQRHSHNEKAWQFKLKNLQHFKLQLQAYEESSQNPSLPAFLDLVALRARQTALGAPQMPNSKSAPKWVSLSTVHAAKGLEYDVVFICGLQDEAFPLLKKGSKAEDLEEERRLFYVALTRARKELYLSWSENNPARNVSADSDSKTQLAAIWNQKSLGPSRFIQEIPPGFRDPGNFLVEQLETSSAASQFNFAHSNFLFQVHT